MRVTSCVVIAAALTMTACANSGPPGATSHGAVTDPRLLVVTLDDLPAGWAPIPGESLRVPLAWVLSDPSSAGTRALIRRERVAGYERSFWSPERRRVECEVSVYRTSKSARTVFERRLHGLDRLFAALRNGRRVRAVAIGEGSVAYRFDSPRVSGVAVAWRYRQALARCTSVGRGASTLRETELVARRQQRRIARALG